MNILVAHIKWIMLVAGILTCTTLYVVISPEAALRSMFGATINSPLAGILARDWGALIFLTGVMLIYGAFHSAYRPLIIVFVCAGKLIFVGLVLSLGQAYLHTAWSAITFDALVSVILLIYLFAAKREVSSNPGG